MKVIAFCSPVTSWRNHDRIERRLMAALAASQDVSAVPSVAPLARLCHIASSGANIGADWLQSVAMAKIEVSRISHATGTFGWTDMRELIDASRRTAYEAHQRDEFLDRFCLCCRRVNLRW